MANSAKRAMNRHGRGVDLSGPAIDTRKAIDLDQFKGGNKVKQQVALRKLLQQHGFVCSCGERFEDEGIMAVGTWTGMTPEAEMTPSGPKIVLKDGATLVMRKYHSTSCVDYLVALKDGIPRDEGELPVPIALTMGLPPMKWFGTLDLPEDDEQDREATPEEAARDRAIQEEALAESPGDDIGG